MRPAALCVFLVLATLSPPAAAQRAPRPGVGGGAFTLEQVRAYPFPTGLTAAATGTRLAWALNEQGQRNLYVAEGPAFQARRLTDYTGDDGQELTSVTLSPDGRWVVYVRGGDHGSNWDDHLPVNATSSPAPPKVQILSVPFAGGEPKVLGDGEEPVISPRSDAVAFVRGGQIWTAPIDGAAPAQPLFTARGENGDPRWSPDGARLAFVSSRGDHAFVGVHTNDTTPILWLAPAFARDRSPRWSPDSRRLAFIRLPGAGGAPDSLLVPRHNPWEIWTADAATGQAQRLWKAPETLRGSVPTTHGGTNLGWAAAGGGSGRIVFLSYHDGWPHLYSIPASGGEPLLLTPGRYMAEYLRLSPDGRWLVFAANAGDALDIDRRHIVRVPVDRAAPEVMTPGDGLEWSPVVTGDGTTLAFLGATPQRPPLPTVTAFARGGTRRTLGADRIPPAPPVSNNWPWTVTPSGARNTTCRGVTRRSVG